MINNLKDYIQLNEKYVNLFKNDIHKYIDEIWNILQKSYKDIDGGFATANTKEELINKTNFVKLVKKDNVILACCLYSDKHGRKLIAVGTDGTKEGKIELYKILNEDVKFKRSWGEFSDKIEHIMVKQGGVPIPNILAKEILNKDIILDDDGYHYYRSINGKQFKKIILSNEDFIKKFT